MRTSAIAAEGARFPTGLRIASAISERHVTRVAHGFNHCRLRTLDKSLLKQPRQWISQSGDHLPGAGKRENVVPDLIFVSIPFNSESLFSALCMFRQGAVGEGKSLPWAFVMDDVDDATGVQRIEPEVTYQNRNLGSNLYRGTRPMKAHPSHAEHSPRTNRFRRPLPRTFASAKLNTIVVYVVPRWRGSGRRSDLRVREA